MGIKIIILFFCFFVSFNLYSQEESSFKNENDSLKLPHDTIEHYFSASLTFEETNNMQKSAYEQVKNLQKNNRTREEDFTLLKNAQLLGFLYPSIDDERVQETIFEVLLSVRDEFLSYSAKNPKDYHIKTELAFLMHSAALVYRKDNSYQFVQIILKLASEVYNKKPNAKVALVLAMWYIGSSSQKIPLMNNKISNYLAKKYLDKAIELDEGLSYITYLAYIYSANLYFKSRNGDKVDEYINEAKELYPNGSFAYIVDEVFFADGKVLF